MKLILVRHGKEDERYRGGWSNRDLTPDGLEQARQLAEHLKENHQHYAVTQIISSDLQRAMTTADCIGDALGLPVQKEARLREMNNGDLAGMLNETALERYPGLFFNTLEMDEAYPNGESPGDFFCRIRLWFEDFCANLGEKDGNVLIVTHGGVIDIIYHQVRGMEWSNKGPSFRTANCSIHVLDLDTMEIEAEEA